MTAGAISGAQGSDGTVHSESELFVRRFGVWFFVLWALSLIGTPLMVAVSREHHAAPVREVGGELVWIGVVGAGALAVAAGIGAALLAAVLAVPNGAGRLVSVARALAFLVALAVALTVVLFFMSMVFWIVWVRLHDGPR